MKGSDPGDRRLGAVLHHHFPPRNHWHSGSLRPGAPAVRPNLIDPLRAAPSLAKGITGVFAEIVSAVECTVVSRAVRSQLALELVLSDADFRSAIDAVCRMAVGAGRNASPTRGVLDSIGQRRQRRPHLSSRSNGGHDLAKSKRMLCRFEALREFCRIGYASGSSRLSWADSHKGRA